MGLDNVQLLDSGGHPALYGAWTRAPGAATLMTYRHYDVLTAWLLPAELVRYNPAEFGKSA